MHNRRVPTLSPGPGRLWPGQLAFAFSRDRLRFLRDLTSRYGDVVFVRIAGEPFAILNHPDYVRDVLVTRHRQFHKGIGLERARLLLGNGVLTSEDDFHDRQRRLILPVFHRERIATYAVTMADYADRRSRTWTAGETRDVAQEMAALALAIAGKTLFDADVEQEATGIGAALTEVLHSFNFAMLPYGDRMVNWPLPPSIRFRRARAQLDATIYRLIAERRASRTTGRDVLSMLVSVRDAEGDGGGMTDEQIRDEALTLLLAGHETTANALTWTWYLLSQNPDAERALHHEMDRVVGGRVPSLEDVNALRWTRAVLSESMRLFPPAYVLGRRALEPYRVPGTDYEIPARTTVLVSQYLLHRDPRFWDEPERFAPERWAVEGQHDARRYTYFPFGAGPRVCIGEHFAWMEATLVLATIARRWRFNLVAGHRVEPDPLITLRTRDGMRMTISARA